MRSTQHYGRWFKLFGCRSDEVTCDLSFLNGEWDDQVEWSQPCHIQTIHSHWSVRCLGRQRVEVRNNVQEAATMMVLGIVNCVVHGFNGQSRTEG